ncbi:MAG: GntR family transcriptional regulator [Bryobacteraceae bacterium]
MKSASLDRTLYVPLYHQLSEILLEEIKSGKLKPDDRLQSEDRMAAAYGVSIITVRRTLSDLATGGFIRRERGRGTFVSRPAMDQGPRELTSFSQEMAKRGVRSSSEILEKKIAGADAEIAAQLRLEQNAQVFVLRRLRLADGEPMGIQTAHIPVEFAEGLMDQDFSTASLYEVLQKKNGLVPAHAREVHFAIAIGSEDAALLGLAENSLGLAAKRWTYLSRNSRTTERGGSVFPTPAEDAAAPGAMSGGRPFEFVNSVMRGDRYRIVLDLVNNQSGR